MVDFHHLKRHYRWNVCQSTITGRNENLPFVNWNFARDLLWVTGSNKMVDSFLFCCQVLYLLIHNVDSSGECNENGAAYMWLHLVAQASN